LRIGAAATVWGDLALLSLPFDEMLLRSLKLCLICKRLELPWLQVVAGALPIGVLCHRCSSALEIVVKMKG